MPARPKKIPLDRSFPVQITDKTDYATDWRQLEPEERNLYTPDQFAAVFCPDLDIEDLEVWFSPKNVDNLTHPSLAAPWEQLHDLAFEEQCPEPPNANSLTDRLARDGVLTLVPTLTDEAGRQERFSKLKKAELAPFCNAVGINPSQKKADIIRELMAAGAEPPQALEIGNIEAFREIIHENLARYVAAVGQNLARFPAAFRPCAEDVLNDHLADFFHDATEFIRAHIGLDMQDDGGRKIEHIEEISRDDFEGRMPPAALDTKQRVGLIGLGLLILYLLYWLGS